jgi:serine/threonine-protein kinase
MTALSWQRKRLDSASCEALRSCVAARIGRRYQIGRELGRGATAIVFVAFDHRLKRAVALKVLRPDIESPTARLRFSREIGVLAGLQHPHILPLHDFGTAGAIDYYVTPYVEGESLRRRLNREPRLSIREAVRITVDLAEALDHVHQHGVVHRDVKPENILLSSGRAMLADFGIAALVGGADDPRITEEFGMPGTPLYMSPEQRYATAAVDGSTDIYSLGIVLVEMLVGVVPRWCSALGDSAEERYRRRECIRRLRPDVSQALEGALLRALSPDPSDRFAAAADFAEALQGSLSEEGCLSTPVERWRGKLSDLISRVTTGLRRVSRQTSVRDFLTPSYTGLGLR